MIRLLVAVGNLRVAKKVRFILTSTTKYTNNAKSTTVLSCFSCVSGLMSLTSDGTRAVDYRESLERRKSFQVSAGIRIGAPGMTKVHGAHSNAVRPAISVANVSPRAAPLAERRRGLTAFARTFPARFSQAKFIGESLDRQVASDSQSLQDDAQDLAGRALGMADYRQPESTGSNVASTSETPSTGMGSSVRDGLRVGIDKPVNQESGAGTSMMNISMFDLSRALDVPVSVHSSASRGPTVLCAWARVSGPLFIWPPAEDLLDSADPLRFHAADSSRFFHYQRSPEIKGYRFKHGSFLVVLSRVLLSAEYDSDHARLPSVRIRQCSAVHACHARHNKHPTSHAEPTGAARGCSSAGLKCRKRSGGWNAGVTARLGPEVLIPPVEAHTGSCDHISRRQPMASSASAI